MRDLVALAEMKDGSGKKLGRIDPHAGDLPNITLSPRGEVKTEIVNNNVT